MTTKPKASKYRLDGPGTAAAKTDGNDDDMLPAPTAADAGLGSEPFPGSAKADRDSGGRSGRATPAEAELSGIKAEGLTTRQLRLAMRMARKHGMEPESDLDAVRLLRAQGIDPFHRDSRVDLLTSDGAPGGAPAQLPQTVETRETLPDAPLDPMARRETEIQEIQRDITRRRRRRRVMLTIRLAVFVLLPTMLAAIYYYGIATPLYATNSQFVIQQADSPQAGLGGLFAGTGLATNQDAVGVQGYLESVEAMIRLDQDIGFIPHFSDPAIDPLIRLPPDATNDEAHSLYTRMVSIGYDPSEGVVRLEVKAADPMVSAAFSNALIAYAEERVDTTTQRLREDQMAGAMENFADAEAKMVAAQERVLELQIQLGVLDPASESAAVMSQITSFEVQLAERRLELGQFLDNPQPNAARVSGVEGDIARLERLIADLRSQLTEDISGARSLAQISGQLRMAEVDLQTRTLMMQEALQQVEASRIQANRQVRYLSTVVGPIPPDDATHPRAFENTLMAFLVFLGIYLMVSITVSILREQV